MVSEWLLRMVLYVRVSKIMAVLHVLFLSPCDVQVSECLVDRWVPEASINLM